MADKKRIPINRVNKFFLYGLYCPVNGDIKYVGVTKRRLASRLSEHLRKPTNSKINLWFKELEKEGYKPLIKVISEYTNYSELLNAEILEIKKYRDKGIKLFNMTDGGDINPMLGKTHTPEAREKISKANKGRKLSSKEIEKRRDILKELWSDEEWAFNVKKKMSENMIGNARALGYRHSSDTKKLLSNLSTGNNHALGFKHSEETKGLLSYLNSGENNPMYGKKLSEESIKKRKETIKKNKTFEGKNNPNFKFDINRGELFDFFIVKNKTISEISKIYGCSMVTISKNLKKYKINKPKSNKYNLDAEKIKKYLSGNLSLVEIGDKFGCSNKIIHKYIKRYNLYEK